MSIAEGFEEFVAVVEEGSLTAAAAALGMPRPTLSRRLARLEERLSVRLLHRTTRRQTLTSQGEALYRKARWVMEAARDAEDEVRRLDGVPRGLLRVSIPSGMPKEILSGWALGFLEAYPEVQLEMVSSSVPVDIVAEGFDAAVHIGRVVQGSVIVRSVVRNQRIAVASPGYLAQRGRPTSVEELAQHECILECAADRSPVRDWPLLGGGQVRVGGSLVTTESGLRLHACVSGYGIALVARREVRSELAAGTLVQLLPDDVGGLIRVSLVYADRVFLEPKVRVFVDFLAERMQAAVASRDRRFES